MKARIVPEDNFFVGEVFGTWEKYMLGIKVREWTGWNKVTSRCFTRIGARMELNIWKNKHSSTEFEL